MPRAAKSRPTSGAKGARKKRAPALVDALAGAAWADADAALAQALIEADNVQSARTSRARADALALLVQALARAARRRGLTRFGKVGASEAYDAARHELARITARPPAQVRVTGQGVARGGEILVKAQVRAMRAKRR